PDAPVGFFGDDTANLESFRADQDTVADLQPELREELRTDNRSVTLEQGMRIRAVTQLHRSIQRKLRADRPQLRHPRCKLRGIRRAHHRWNLGRFGAKRDAP